VIFDFGIKAKEKPRLNGLGFPSIENRHRFRLLLSMFYSQVAEKVSLCFLFIALESLISTNHP